MCMADAQACMYENLDRSEIEAKQKQFDACMILSQDCEQTVLSHCSLESAWSLIKATRTIVGEAYILPLNFFLQRTVIAAIRRSGAQSKVYQWLGPRCRQNRSPNF